MRYGRTLMLVAALIFSIPFFFFLWLISLICRKRTKFTARYSSRLWAIWSEIMLRVAGIKITRDGLEQFPSAEKPMFIFAKHSSFLDVLALLAAPKLTYVFISKKPVLPMLPFFDRAAFSSFGVAIPVYLKESAGPDRKLRNQEELSRLLLTVKEGIYDCIVAFPEGTRSNHVNSLHSGLFNIAFSSKQGIIIPTIIKNADKILPKSRFWLGNVKSLVVRFGRPIRITEHHFPEELRSCCRAEFVRMWEDDC